MDQPQKGLSGLLGQMLFSPRHDIGVATVIGLRQKPGRLIDDQKMLVERQYVHGTMEKTLEGRAMTFAPARGRGFVFSVFDC